jgi:hypothetical protein
VAEVSQEKLDIVRPYFVMFKSLLEPHLALPNYGILASLSRDVGEAAISRGSSAHEQNLKLPNFNLFQNYYLKWELFTITIV